MTPLKKNLAVLQQHHPTLFSIAQEPISTSHLTLVPTKSGAARLMVTTVSGDVIPLHDSDNPLQPIQHMAKQIGSNLSGIRVVLGFELGYLAKFLSHQLPHNAALIFYEADPAIFLMALNVVDLTDVLSHPRVAIHIGPQAILQHTCSDFLSQVGGPLETLVYEPSLRVNPDLYQEKFEQELTNMGSLLSSAQQIVDWDGALLTNNIFRNLPHILKTPSARPLRNMFQDLPALLVAAGPSLAKNVEHLKAAKGHTMIIVADTALKYLLDHDVVPDFVVSIDPQETTSRKYEDLTIPPEVTLLFHPATHHRLVAQFPGRKLTMDISHPACEWMQRHWESKGQFDQEATCQIQVGFNFAAWMGCNPLVLVGHDMCFTEEGMHVTPASYLAPHEKTKILSQAHTITDQNGHLAKTTPTLEHDKRVLEKKIRDFSGKVINATEGGQAIEGTLPTALDTVLAKFQGDDPIEVRSILYGLAPDSLEPDLSVLREDIQDRSRDIFRMERTAYHVCRILSQMKDHQQQSGEFLAYALHLGKQAEHLTSFMPRYPQAQALLCGMDQTITKRFQQDTLTCEREPDPRLRRHLEIDRGIRYYEGMQRVAPSLRHMLSHLLKQLEPEQQPNFEEEESLEISETPELVNQ